MLLLKRLKSLKSQLTILSALPDLLGKHHYTLLLALLARRRATRHQINAIRYTNRPRISSTKPFSQITIDTFDAVTCHSRTGWTIAEVKQLLPILSTETTLKIAHRVLPRDITVFMSLERLRKGSDFNTFVDIWGGDPRRWGEGFTWFLDRCEHYAKGLAHRDTLLRYAPVVYHFRGETFARVEALNSQTRKASFTNTPTDSINTVLRADLPQSPAFEPWQGAATTFGFLDATNFATTNPSDSLVQTSFYTGHQKRCCLKALTVVGPNGMTLLLAITSGRLPDHCAVNEIDLLARLQEFCLVARGPTSDDVLSVYGDKVRLPSSGGR